jgi:hypothetical protein
MLDSLDGFVGDEGCQPKRNAWRVEMESAVSEVLLPAPFAWPLSIFRYTEGLIPNPPNRSPSMAKRLP